MRLQTKRAIGIVIVTAMATLMMGRLFGDKGAGGFLIGVGFITFIYSQLGVRFKQRIKDSGVIRKTHQRRENEIRTDN